MNGAVPLLFAMLIMVCLATVPRRAWYVRLSAVLGWMLVWLDNELSHHGLDYLGLAIFGASLGVLGRNGFRSRQREGSAI